jgi:ankyrin repeat protein
MLIQRGADINKGDNEGKTPLYWALDKNNLPLVESLLSKGADINKGDNEGKRRYIGQ